MQRIELVKNGNLEQINKLLSEGYIVKNITPIAETVAIDGVLRTTMGQTTKGNIYAYIVLEK